MLAVLLPNKFQKITQKKKINGQTPKMVRTNEQQEIGLKTDSLGVINALTPHKIRHGLKVITWSTENLPNTEKKEQK